MKMREKIAVDEGVFDKETLKDAKTQAGAGRGKNARNAARSLTRKADAWYARNAVFQNAADDRINSIHVFFKLVYNLVYNIK